MDWMDENPRQVEPQHETDWGDCGLWLLILILGNTNTNPPCTHFSHPPASPRAFDLSQSQP